MMSSRRINIVFVLFIGVVPVAGVTMAGLLPEAFVSVGKDAVFGLTGTNTPVEFDLAAGEHVLYHAAKGINALVETNTRLLAFSSQTMAWSEQPVNLYERVLERRVVRRFMIVRTGQHVYGFQGSVGFWKVQDLGVREQVKDIRLSGTLAVVITDRQLLGFSALSGGFYAKDLFIDERVADASINDSVILLTTNIRRLVLRSELAEWAEIP
jgi:hypothetical protein